MNEPGILRWEIVTCIAVAALATVYLLLFYGLKLKEMFTSKKKNRKRRPKSSPESEAATENGRSNEVQAIQRGHLDAAHSTGDKSKTGRRDHVDWQNSRSMDESSGRRTETYKKSRRRTNLVRTVPADTRSSDGGNADNLTHKHCTKPVGTELVDGEGFGPGSSRNRTKPARTVAIGSGYHESFSDKDTTVGSISPEPAVQLDSKQGRMKGLTATRRDGEKSLEGHSDREGKGKDGDLPLSNDFKEEETGYEKVDGEGHKKTRKPRQRRKRGSKGKGVGAVEGLPSPETVAVEPHTHASFKSTSCSEQSKYCQPAVGKATETLVPHRERCSTARAVNHRSVQDQYRANAARARPIDNENHGPVPGHRRTNTARRGSVNKTNYGPERDQPRTNSARTKPFNRWSHEPQAEYRRSNSDRTNDSVNLGSRQCQKRNNPAKTKSTNSVNYGPALDHPAGNASIESGSDGSQPDQRRSSLDSSIPGQYGPKSGRTASFDSGYHGSVSECDTSDEMSSREPSVMQDSDVLNTSQEQVGTLHDSKSALLNDSRTAVTANSANDSTKISDTSSSSSGKEIIKKFDTEGEIKESKMLKKPFKRRADLRLPSWPPQDNYLFIVDRPSIPGYKNISFVHGDWGEDLDPRLCGPRKGPWAYDYDDEEMAGPSVVTDNICEMFMKWGVCRAGDMCTQRHPSCRYPCVPKPKPSQADPSACFDANQSNPRSSEPLTLSRSSTPRKQRTETYATVIARLDRLKVSRDDPSLATLRGINSEDNNSKKKYEEAWPSLSSPRDGNISKAKMEDRQPSGNNCASPTSFWSATQSINQPVDNPSDLYQVANDRLVAEAVQEQENAGGYDYEQEHSNDLFYGDEYDEDEHFGSYEDNPFSEEGAYVSSNNNTSGSNSGASQLESSTASYQEKLNAFGSSERRDETATQGGHDTHSTTVPLVQSTQPVDPKDLCEICMDGPKDATLLCGHRFCFLCAHQMRVDEHQCAICRRPILTVIKTYN